VYADETATNDDNDDDVTTKRMTTTFNFKQWLRIIRIGEKNMRNLQKMYF